MDIKKYGSIIAAKMRLPALFPILLLLALPASATIRPGFNDQLSWTAPTNLAVHYVLYRGPASNVWTFTNTIPIGVTNYVMTNLTFGVWWATVRAVTISGVQSDQSIFLTWTNLPDPIIPPPPPTNLQIQTSTNTSALLDVPLRIGTNIIESASDPAGPWTQFLTLVNLSADPAKEVILRVASTDPRRFFQASQLPLTARLLRPPPVPAVRQPPKP